MNQEPLGVAPDIVLPQDLVRWSDMDPAHYLTDYSAIGETKHNASPFPYDADVNHKIILWWVNNFFKLLKFLQYWWNARPVQWSFSILLYLIIVI